MPFINGIPIPMPNPDGSITIFGQTYDNLDNLDIVVDNPNDLKSPPIVSPSEAEELNRLRLEKLKASIAALKAEKDEAAALRNQPSFFQKNKNLLLSVALGLIVIVGYLRKSK